MEVDEEEVNQTVTLKAAIHFTVGRMCEEIGTERDVTFSRHFISALAELTSRQLQTYSQDLEAFANHARRTTINKDDIKLLVRRNAQMAEHIRAMIENEEEEKKKGKGDEGKKKKREKPKKNEEETRSSEDQAPETSASS